MLSTAYIPPEIWIEIGSKHFFAFQVMFSINKHIHSQLILLKDRFIRYQNCYSVFDDTGISVDFDRLVTIVNHGDDMCQIIYNTNKYIANFDFNDAIIFKECARLNILMIYVSGLPRYTLCNKVLYDANDVNFEMYSAKGKDLNYLASLVHDQTSCNLEVALFLVIRWEGDVIAAIMDI